MKIECDVCSEESASFFCPADDAALCVGCDQRVHGVNKVAGKHHRFSLTTTQHIPLCDICQENRAFLFCQQDRAILCSGCDYSIHNANHTTRNHNRFLLTGTNLSLHPPPPPPSHSAATPIIPPSCCSSSSSSISEYLIETIPGWRVDDFLDSNPHSFDLSKGVSEEELVLMSVWESEFRGNLTSTISSENSRISTPKMAVINGDRLSFSKWTEEEDDRSFTVPQILNNNSNASKRSRFA